MPLEQHLEQAQKLILTQAMQQSLHCLQMSALELRSYLQEAALSNPLLEIEDQPLGELPPEAVDSSGVEFGENLPIEQRDQLIWDMPSSGEADLSSYVSRQESFTDYLNSQLGQMSLLDADTLARCRYLVGCLNSAGYLDCSLPDLAQETGQSLFDMEQALFIVQALDPPGTGARSLSECLLLQLAQGSAFTETNIHLIQSGLSLLAENDLPALAALLHISQQEARAAADTIRRLNPIPSRGFYTENRVPFVIPEATIRPMGDRAVIEMNSHILPQVSLNETYCALIGRADLKDAQLYLREKLAEAKNLLSHLENRSDTLFRLLSAVVELQQDHFLKGAPLQPMTMRQLADRLELNISTVSRAVKDKYIQFNGKVLPLRSLFSMSLPTADGRDVSADTARQHLRRFITAENPSAPLSDEALRQALAGVNILLSRRTVSKYRAELGIPAASARKRRS